MATAQAEIDLSFLEHLTDDELKEMLAAHSELERKLEEEGPQNDDELHAWLIAELGIDVPRTAVCEDHDPPFTFLADLYFERTDAALLMANRGGSKTFLVAVLHWLNSKFKPGCESCTFGATEAQSLRAYAHLKGWIYDEEGEKRPEIASSIMRETHWRNGSKVEVLPGTKTAVNGPHPQKAHADEIELMDDETWKESRNMTVSKRLPSGDLIKPQDIATSTRKGPTGRMQELIDEISDAIKSGMSPPRKLYQWCIKETAAQIPNCRVARPDLPEEEKCQCHTIQKGEWEPGKPRLLMHICDGDFYKSRGWQPPEDVIKHFRENDPETFAVQQLCQKPEMQFHYLPTYTEQRYGIKVYPFDPELGPCFTSTDWGGTNPHAVGWYQLLNYEIEVEMFLSTPETPIMRRLKEGTLVRFDEIYKAEIGNEALGQLVIEKEQQYREAFPGFKISKRFADPQGKAARLDWKNMGLTTSWHTTREFDEHIKDVKNRVSDDTFYVVAATSPWFWKEVAAWRKDEKGSQVDEFNHVMSEMRYAIANIKRIGKRYQKNSGQAPQTKRIQRRVVRTASTRRAGPVSIRGRKPTEFDNWRASLGQPVTQVRR